MRRSDSTLGDFRVCVSGMGTKVQGKSYLPGYYSMRDLNEDSSSCNWPIYYEDKSLSSGQYCNGFLPRVAIDSYPGYDKDSVKQTMLEHEVTFKNQVCELHRLYRIQRDMMDGAKRKELCLNRIQVETSLSSGPLASQSTSEDARKWTSHGVPMVSSVYDRPSTSVVEGIHSPLSSMEGANMHAAGPYSSQNGCSLKDIEVLESRATKVQRKLFDVQLPADACIDTEEREQVRNDKASAISSSYRRSCEMVHKNGVKFNGDDARKTGDCRGDSDRLWRSPNGLADLNEPIQLEDVHETTTSVYDFCNGKIHDSAQSCKPNSELLGLPKEISVNSYRSDIDTQSNIHLHKYGNGRGWFFTVPEVVQGKSEAQSLPRFLRTEFPHSSQQTQGSSSSVYEPTFHRSDKSKVALCKDEMVFGAEFLKRTPDLANSKNHALLATSPVTDPYQVSHPNLAKPWSHSWEKPSSSFNQGPISAQTPGGLNAATVSNGSRAWVRSDGILGDRLYINSNTKSNPAFGGESLRRNGFYQESLAGTKEQPIHIPSSSVDYVISSNENDRPPIQLTSDRLANYHKGSNGTDVKSPKDMNLNLVVSDSSSNQEMPVREIEILRAEKKRDDHLVLLPWLRPKPACKNEVAEFRNISKTSETSIFQSSRNQSPEDCNQHFAESVQSFPGSSGFQARKIEPTDCPGNKKLLGFHIFKKPNVSKNDLSSSCNSLPVSFTKPSENKGVDKPKIIFDMNLPCDPATPDLFQQSEEESAVVVEKVTEEKSGGFRHHIDLNGCLSDDDDASLKPSSPITRVNTMVCIDLEAPAVLEEAEEDVILGEESASKHNEAPVTSPKCDAEVQGDDELITAAAEAIVAISASICQNHVNGESSPADPLTWFVKIASWCGDGDNLEGQLGAALRVEDGNDNAEEDSSEESDHFESMILQLKETREEDYMPAAPLAPENLTPEEAGPALPTARPRKGQGKRGRKRRDFQRDILPGLASLSRHEVTKDLQTFGGLMQAAGHPWQSGQTRRSSGRNGGGRGRRRAAVSPPTTPSCGPTPLAVQIHSGAEPGPEENRSLAGWGKTTRRPRRQRCPAGNPTSLLSN